MKIRLVLPFCVFTIFFLSVLARGAVADTAPSLASGAGRHAPAFTLPTLNGGPVSLDSLRGKVVFVDFWASWCGPCKRSFPWLRTLQERYSSKGLTVVAIDLDKNREAADAFLAQIPAPFVVAFDPAGKTAEAFEVKAMPSSFIIGPTGDILYTHAGFDPGKTEAIEKLIQEAFPR